MLGYKVRHADTIPMHATEPPHPQRKARLARSDTLRGSLPATDSWEPTAQKTIGLLTSSAA
jgi:hypothetical protein